MEVYNLSDEFDKIEFEDEAYIFGYISAYNAQNKQLTNDITEEYWNQFKSNILQNSIINDLEKAKSLFKISFSKGWNYYFRRGVK